MPPRLSAIPPPAALERATWAYLLSAVLVFLLVASVTLGGLLRGAHIPLSSADPFYAKLSIGWIVVAVTFVLTVLGLVHLAHRATHQWNHHWTWGDLRLGSVLMILGFLGGAILFQVRYAQVQATVTAALSDQFLSALRTSGLDQLGAPLTVADNDEPVPIMWAATPQQCSQAKGQWDRLDASWAQQKSGGAIPAAALKATFLRTLWFHGCVSDSDYVAQRQRVTQDALAAQERLSHERVLPVMGHYWPWRTWSAFRAPMLARVALSRRQWCEDQISRAGFEAHGAETCVKLADPNGMVRQATEVPGPGPTLPRS
jgi:hypothetical protein